MAAAAGVQVVVYAINPAYTAWATQALPLARLGMDVAQRLGATFMLPGNVYNFGAQMPPLLQERTPQRADTRKGRIRVAIEEELRSRAAQGLRSVVIRASDFFGSGSGSWLDLVIAKSLAKGRLVYPGPLDRAHAWAYLPDLARAFVAVADRRDELPAFAPLHFAGHTVTGAEFLDTVERAALSLGVAPVRGFRRSGMPWGLIRTGGLVMPMWREIAEMSYLWDVPHGLAGDSLERLIGEQETTRLETALLQSLRALGVGPAPANPNPGSDLRQERGPRADPAQYLRCAGIRETPGAQCGGSTRNATPPGGV